MDNSQNLKEGIDYKTCAIQCVKDTVLPLMKQRFDACNGNVDAFFSCRWDSIYSFQTVIEPGHVYEFGYPRCLCPLYANNSALSAAQCECSRQSILFILGELFPQTTFQVEILETVLGGAQKCRFRITI